MTKERIEASPSLENNKPVSRQFEESLFGYYGLSTHWNGMNSFGPVPIIMEGEEKPEGYLQDREDWDPNLRSMSDIMGHHVQASDTEIGHIEDFIIDDQTWEIRYLVIDTRNWLPGKKILISPQWIERVSWTEAKVFVHLTAETIKSAPEYDDDTPITREYEQALHNYFERKGYWVDDPDEEDIN